MAFYHPKNPKNQNFEKMIKMLETPSFYTCVPKITIILWTVPEIQNENDRIFPHFRLYFVFFPPNDTENQNFKKMKKMPGDIILLHKSAKYCDHMLQCSWDMMRDGQNFLSLWIMFCSFNPLTIQFWKKWKKDLDILSL